jgi:hypothetical protein
MSNSASGEAHQNWFIKQPNGEECKSENAADAIGIRRHRREKSYHEQQRDNNAVDDEGPQSLRKSAIGGLGWGCFCVVRHRPSQGNHQRPIQPINCQLLKR